MSNDYTHPTDNYTCFADVVDVTLRPQLPVGTVIEEVKAKKRPLNGRELSWAASVGLVNENCSWILWTETLGGVTPKIGDEVVDAAGTVWQIQQCVAVTFATRWRCLCSKKDA